MGSLLKPYVGNAILGDVAAIRANTLALAKWDVASLADLVSGVKTVAEGAQGYEFQLFNGSTWSRMEKWNIDAASVDGFSASKDPIPNVIAVRTSTGELMGDILGNAATASSAKTLSEVLSLDLGGTGANTPAQARSNLGVPPTAHASDQPTYGLATAELYGHAKGSDSPDRTLTADTGTFLSPAGGWAMLDEYDEGVVHRSGDEHIAGMKTFARSVLMENGVHKQWVADTFRPYMYQNANITKGTTPSATTFCYTAWYSSSGMTTADRIAMNEMAYRNDGSVWNSLVAFSPEAGSTAVAAVRAVYPATGSPYGLAPTTPAGSTGAEIVTADYLAGANSNVVHRTGGEFIEGVKIFTNYLGMKNEDVTLGGWEIGSGTANNRYFQYRDKNDDVISAIQFRMESDSNAIRFMVQRPGDTTTPISSRAVLAAEVNSQGVGRVYAVAPVASSDTNDLATTAWVRDRFTISTAAPSGGTNGDFWFQY